MRIGHTTLVAASLLAAGCNYETQSQGVVATTNQKAQVELLFEVDGVKVYRFVDYGHARYFADARGRVEGGHTVHHGKTTQYVSDSTETVGP